MTSNIKTKLPKRVQKWLAEKGYSFRNPVPGTTNYSAGTHPFPMNPLFKPKPPLDNAIKDKIYIMFTENGQSTVNIGEELGISIKRVEAVLKLKHQEKKMISQGIPIETDFCKNMESMLGVKPDKRAKEPLRNIIPKVNKPFFVLVGEDDEFTPDDAAKLLKREPFATIQKTMDMKPFVLEEKKQKEEVIVIRKDETEANSRFRFVFNDISTDRRRVYVREKDGTLVQRVEAR
ncbi:hypothetical protein G9A89_007456 [Geosiphon pyriformis]|nr:hypothetical protein G9A89_007456 [Geosiphon pyriformis]